MKNLKKYIKKSNVPDHDTKQLWEKIESKILVDGFYGEINRTVFEKALQNLPESEPMRDLWPCINLKIEDSKPDTSIFYLRNHILKIAATIFLIISSYMIIRLMFPEIHQNKINTLRKEPIESFLAYICTRYPNKCQEPDFIELKSEIIRLENEKTEIESSIFFNPSDASIAKINTRINDQMINLKDQIIDYVE